MIWHLAWHGGGGRSNDVIHIFHGEELGYRRVCAIIGALSENARVLFLSPLSPYLFIPNHLTFSSLITLPFYP